MNFSKLNLTNHKRQLSSFNESSHPVTCFFHHGKVSQWTVDTFIQLWDSFREITSAKSISYYWFCDGGSACFLLLFVFLRSNKNFLLTFFFSCLISGSSRVSWFSLAPTMEANTGNCCCPSKILPCFKCSGWALHGPGFGALLDRQSFQICDVLGDALKDLLPARSTHILFLMNNYPCNFEVFHRNFHSLPA